MGRTKQTARKSTGGKAPRKTYGWIIIIYFLLMNRPKKSKHNLASTRAGVTKPTTTKERFEGRCTMRAGSDSYVHWAEGEIGGNMKVYHCKIKHDPTTGLLIPPTSNEKAFRGDYKKNPSGDGYGATDKEGGKFTSTAKYRRYNTIRLIPRSPEEDKRVYETYLDPSF